MGAVDSPNLYAFVGWAPHMGRDPLGQYGEDVHRDLTGYLALRAGFSVEEAKEIADANQGVDEDKVTSPLVNARKGRWNVLLEYHMPIQKGEKKVRRNSPAARKRVDSADNLADLGSGLHTLQDSYSHEESYVGNIIDQSKKYPKDKGIKILRAGVKNDEVGIGHPDRPEIGSRADTKACDNTSIEPDKAMAMAQNTFSTLIGYRLRIGEITQQEADRLAERWDRMEPAVREWAEADSKKEKKVWIGQYAYQIRED